MGVSRAFDVCLGQLNLPAWIITAENIKGLLVCIQRANRPKRCVAIHQSNFAARRSYSYSNVHSTLFQILGVEKTKWAKT
ncbi:hypothetical protein, partial [Kingella kingae]|uniref:hypothetical protein n=1 Tax=Kingella kingae TaxID=504 RepID=UPI001E324998